MDSITAASIAILVSCLFYLVLFRANRVRRDDYKDRRFEDL